MKELDLVIMAYNLDELEDLHSKQDNFSVLHYNIRSIGKNLEQLSAYLSQHTFKYDIIAITETWLKQGETVQLLGYVTVSQPRPGATRGGGVALFIKNDIQYVPLPESSIC